MEAARTPAPQEGAGVQDRVHTDDRELGRVSPPRPGRWKGRELNGGPSATLDAEGIRVKPHLAIPTGSFSNAESCLHAQNQCISFWHGRYQVATRTKADWSTERWRGGLIDWAAGKRINRCTRSGGQQPIRERSEKTASLDLRFGCTEVIGTYIRHERIREGRSAARIGDTGSA